MGWPAILQRGKASAYDGFVPEDTLARRPLVCQLHQVHGTQSVLMVFGMGEWMAKVANAIPRGHRQRLAESHWPQGTVSLCFLANRGCWLSSGEWASSEPQTGQMTSSRKEIARCCWV